MIVFDAGVLIAHLDRADAFHDSAVEFLEKHEELEYYVTPMTLAECLVRPTDSGAGTAVRAALQRLHFEPFDLSADDAAGIAAVRAATRLRMPDSLVLYAAERLGAELVTTDRELARAAELRGVRAHALEPATKA